MSSQIERELVRHQIIVTELRPMLEKAESRFTDISDREIWKRWALYLYPGSVWMPDHPGTDRALKTCTSMCYDVHHKDSHYREMYGLISIMELESYASKIADIAKRIYMSPEDLPLARTVQKMESVSFIIEPHGSTEQIAILTSGRTVTVPAGGSIEDLLRPYSYTEYE